MDRPTTSTSGDQMVYGWIGEMIGKSEMMATERKYRFAILRNCSYRPFGKNVMGEYLPVEMALPLNRNRWLGP